ncbi:hypothetical protein MRX96_021786 [Rhipicephalus microplus]
MPDVQVFTSFNEQESVLFGERDQSTMLGSTLSISPRGGRNSTNPAELEVHNEELTMVLRSPVIFSLDDVTYRSIPPTELWNGEAEETFCAIKGDKKLIPCGKITHSSNQNYSL